MAVTDSPLHLRCENQDIEQVLEFKYLGSTVLNTGSTEKDTLCRIGQASGTFNRLRPIWRSQNFSLRLKLRLFNSNVIPVLLYASETRDLNNTQERRILAFKNTCLRRILNIHFSQKISNEKVRRMTGQPIVTDVIRTRRWKYLGNVLRMDDSQIPKATFQSQPEGRRRRSRPCNTLRRTYQTDLRNINASLQPAWEDVLAAAHMRDDWRLLVDPLGASGGTGGSKV